MLRWLDCSRPQPCAVQYTACGVGRVVCGVVPPNDARDMDLIFLTEELRGTYESSTWTRRLARGLVPRRSLCNIAQ